MSAGQPELSKLHGEGSFPFCRYKQRYGFCFSNDAELHSVLGAAHEVGLFEDPRTAWAAHISWSLLGPRFGDGVPRDQQAHWEG